MTTTHTLEKFYYGGKTLDVPIHVEGYTGDISDQSLKGIAALLYHGETGKLHKSKKIKSSDTVYEYIHEVDKELLEVTHHTAGKIKVTGPTAVVETIGSITIGRTGKVNNNVHTFKK